MAGTQRPRRRLLRRLGIALAAVVGVIVAFGLLLVLLVDERVVADRMQQWVLPRFEERLNREVELDRVSVRLLPKPRVVLEKLRVVGDGEVPLVEVPRAEVELALWPLIRSFGNEIRVVGVDLHGAELNLIREDQGRWNFEGLGKGRPPSEREVVVDRITTHGGLVRIIDRSTGHGEATVVLTRVDSTARNIGPGLPLTFQGSAAFASDEPNLQVDASVDRLPASMDELAPGGWPAVAGMLSLTNARMPRLEAFLPARLGAMITGGLLDLDAELKSAPEGTLQIAGNANLDALRLRGEPASGSFDLALRISPQNVRAPHVEVTNLALQGPGLQLNGSATLEGSPPRVQFALQGPLLDLETLLGAMPESPERTQPDARTSALPASIREKIDAIQVSGILRFDRVVNGSLEATGVTARGQLKDGQLLLEQGQANFYQGRVDLGGTRVNLTAPVPEWTLQARLQGVDVSNALSNLSGQASPLEGRVDASLSLDGKGADWNAIAPTLTGQGSLAMRDGVLTTTDMGAQLANGLAMGLQAVGRTGEAKSVSNIPGKTPLGQLTSRFHVRNGWLQLDQPLAFEAPFGSARLDGRIGLTKQLDLRGQVALSQAFVASSLRAFNLPVRGPVELPVTVGGTLLAPSVGVSQPQQVASRLLRGEVDRRAQQLEQEVKRRARRRIPDEVRRYIPMPR
ncbi:MAG: AsmA family protein [Myxococcaceae bacterium]